jgi:hypothetical protein
VSRVGDSFLAAEGGWTVLMNLPPFPCGLRRRLALCPKASGAQRPAIVIGIHGCRAVIIEVHFKDGG